MTEAKKFLFDTSFDEPTDDDGAAVREARAEAFEEGKAAGRAEVEGSAEQLAAQAAQAIAARLGEIQASREALDGVLTDRATRAALAMMRKIVPGLIAKSGLDEVEALLRECFERLLDEPRIVVRVAESMLDPLQERIDRIATDAGFTGDMVLLSDGAMGPTDCRIEWADGGAERDAEAVWKDVETTINRWLEQS